MTSDEIHQLMAAELLQEFGHKEGMNKKIQKHKSFKEYSNGGNR